MNFGAVKGLTIPAPKVVVEETTETSITYYLEYGEEENAKLIEGNNYLVTVDGAKYSCTAFFDSNNDAVALGDSEYEDTPFYIMNYVYNTTLTGEDYELYIQYPDSDTHTIEIAEVVEKAVTQITDASGRVIWAVQGGGGEGSTPDYSGTVTVSNSNSIQCNANTNIGVGNNAEKVTDIVIVLQGSASGDGVVTCVENGVATLSDGTEIAIDVDLLYISYSQGVTINVYGESDSGDEAVFDGTYAWSFNVDV